MSRNLKLAIALAVLLPLTSQVFAVEFKGKGEAFSLPNIIRLWPAYGLLAAAIAVGCYRMIRVLLKPKSKVQIFPKLAQRRRLHAPYSGGNCASVAFDSHRDA
jgi:hypothetical protein